MGGDGGATSLHPLPADSTCSRLRFAPDLVGLCVNAHKRIKVAHQRAAGVPAATRRHNAALVPAHPCRRRRPAPMIQLKTISCCQGRTARAASCASVCLLTCIGRLVALKVTGCCYQGEGTATTEIRVRSQYARLPLILLAPDKRLMESLCAGVHGHNAGWSTAARDVLARLRASSHE